MDQLSSCYFCGGALDASLDEYPVVPKALHPSPDDQRTVVLCRGCRRKLGTVVETVVAAVDDRSAPADDEPATRAAERTADRSGDDGEWVSGDSLTDDAGVETGEADPLAGNEPESEPGVDERAGEESDADADVADSAPSTGSVGDGDGRAAGTATGDDGPDDGPSLTALEYNKVMRLLQNREFPVDRAEIRTVAVNAYGISGSEFDAIIDAAVERGLIDEADGQFVDGS